jgi:uncharacterized protein YegJ (DUF2314 family)
MARLLAALIALLFLVPHAVPARAAEEKTILVPDGDPEMNAAIAKARGSLTRFWTALEVKPPGSENFSLKVAITDGDQVEHFLTVNVERKDGKIFADIDNEPQFVTNVAYGRRIEVPEADISDWMFWRNGKVVGGETLRVLLERMTPEEKKEAGVDWIVFEDS